MDKFSIAIKEKIPKKKQAKGRIVIGDFSESFIASLHFWSIEDYNRQWREALLRITSGAVTSSLFTSVVDPKRYNYLWWWPIYREGQLLRIHNQMLILHQLNSKFDINDPYRHIPPYESIDEDGNKISEWVTSVSAIEDFLNKTVLHGWNVD